MGKRVNLVRKDGTVFSAPEEDVPSLLTLGYVPEAAGDAITRVAQRVEEENYSTAGQMALAGVEGLASGATLGASDLVLDFAGADTAKRAEYNPNMRIATEVVGALATAIPTGGASIAGKTSVSALGRLARYTPSGALSHATARAGSKIGGLKGALAGAGVEGGIAGVGAEVSRATLADDPLTVENTLASAGFGFMFGTAAGGLAHGLGRMGTKAPVDGLVKPGLTLEEETIEALGGTRLIPSHNPTPRIEHFEPPAAAPRQFNLAEARHQVYRGMLPDDELARVGSSIDDFAESADKLLAETRDAHAAVAKAAPGDRGHLRPPDKGHLANKNPLAEEAHRARAASDEVINKVMLEGSQTARNLAKTTRAQWKYVEKAVRDGDAKELETWLAKHKESANLLAEAMGTDIKWPGPAKMLNSLKDVAEYSYAVNKLKDMPRKAVDFFDMSDRAAEEYFAAISKVLKTSLPEAAPVQDALTRSLERLADTAGIRVEKGGADAVSRMRATWAAGREAGNAARQGILDQADSVQRHVDSATTIKGDTGNDHNLLNTPLGAKPDPWVKRETTLGSKPKKPEPVEEPERSPSWGERAGAAAKRAAMAGGVSIATGGTAMFAARSALVGMLMSSKAIAVDKLKTAVNALSKTAPAVRRIGPRIQPLATSLYGLPDSKEDMKRNFAARSKEIRDLFANGKDRAFLTAQDLSAAGHPEFALAAYNSATHALDVLMRKLPKDPPGTRWGTESIWQAPEEQMVIFSQEYAAATQPVEFLAQALGDPSSVFPSAIEVVEEAWPAVYNNFRSQVLIRLSEIGTSGMSHEQLVGFSVLLRVPLSPHMAPENIQDSLAMFQQPPPAPAAPQIMPSTPGANEEATASQRQGL